MNVRGKKPAGLLADGLSSKRGTGMILHGSYGFICILM